MMLPILLHALALWCDHWTGAEVLARARFAIEIPEGWEVADVSICHGKPRGDHLMLRRTAGADFPRIQIAVAARQPSTPPLDDIVAFDDQAHLGRERSNTLKRLAPRFTVGGRRVLLSVVSGEHHSVIGYIDDGPRVVYAALDGDAPAMVDSWLEEFLRVVRSFRAREASAGAR